eukprot:8210-Heterococcus_DN1.PRE.1
MRSITSSSAFNVSALHRCTRQRLAVTLGVGAADDSKQLIELYYQREHQSHTTASSLSYLVCNTAASCCKCSGLTSASTAAPQLSCSSAVWPLLEAPAELAVAPCAARNRACALMSIAA